MTVDEVRRFIEAVQMFADAFVTKHAGSKGIAGAAFVAGAEGLRDHLRDALDVRRFAALEPDTNLAEAVERMTAFCSSMCSRISRDVAPGEHDDCKRCPLAPITIEPLRRQVATTTEG